MLQKVHKILFFPFIFKNLDSSFNIEDRLFKFSVVVLGIIIEGTVSQTFYLSPRFCFM